MPKHDTILCLAVTPAVQRTQFLSSFQPGEVNRIRRTIVTASGKGVNVALALHYLGSTPRLLGFCGGDSGHFVADEMKRIGIEARWIEVPTPTRHCHTLIEDESGRVTELVEEAFPPAPEHWQHMAHQLDASLNDCTWMAISGALPPGAPPHALVDACFAAVKKNVRLCIDSQGEPLLQTLAAKPSIVKLNTEELERTCGLPDRSVSSLQRGAAKLQQLGAGAVLVTDGAHPVRLYEGDKQTTLHPPAIHTVNPIGSGDCVTAGILHALTRGHSMAEAAWFGIACGSANAETETPACIDPARVESLRKAPHHPAD